MNWRHVRVSKESSRTTNLDSESLPAVSSLPTTTCQRRRVWGGLWVNGPTSSDDYESTATCLVLLYSWLPTFRFSSQITRFPSIFFQFLLSYFQPNQKYGTLCIVKILSFVLDLHAEIRLQSLYRQKY